MAKVETTSLGTGGEDELAAILGDEDFDTGLEQVDGDDLQIPVKVFNMKGKDPETGRAMAPDVFFDTVAEETQEQIEAVLTYLHKTHEWREYDEAEGRSRVRCRSLDRVTGTMEDNTQRPCEGCPDARWVTINGKRTRRCGPVYNVYGVEKETRRPFVIRFKRTSLRAIKQYLNRHFIGKRIVKGKRANYPLFAMETKVGLRMSEDGKYALPVLQRGAVLDAESIKAAAAEVPFVRQMLTSQLERIVDEDPDHEEVVDGEMVDGAPAARDEFADDGGQQAANF